MKTIIQTDKAPAPIGPYSQAVEANGFVFLSGQIAINVANGNIDTSTIHAETHQVMENIKNVLAERGLTMENIVKTSIFLKNMDDFVEVNGTYATYFEKNPPARETVQVSRLPKDVNVEISVIAVVN